MPCKEKLRPIHVYKEITSRWEKGEFEHHGTIRFFEEYNITPNKIKEIGISLNKKYKEAEHWYQLVLADAKFNPIETIHKDRKTLYLFLRPADHSEAYEEDGKRGERRSNKMIANIGAIYNRIHDIEEKAELTKMQKSFWKWAKRAAWFTIGMSICSMVYHATGSFLIELI